VGYAGAPRAACSCCRASQLARSAWPGAGWSAGWREGRWRRARGRGCQAGCAGARGGALGCAGARGGTLGCAVPAAAAPGRADAPAPRRCSHPGQGRRRPCWAAVIGAGAPLGGRPSLRRSRGPAALWRLARSGCPCRRPRRQGARMHPGTWIDGVPAVLQTEGEATAHQASACTASSSPTALARLQRPQSVSEAAGCGVERPDPCGRTPCRTLARCEALTSHRGSGRRRRLAGAAWPGGTRPGAPAARRAGPGSAPAHPAAAPAPAAARRPVALVAERSLQQPLFRPEHC